MNDPNDITAFALTLSVDWPLLENTLTSKESVREDESRNVWSEDTDNKRYSGNQRPYHSNASAVP